MYLDYSYFIPSGPGTCLVMDKYPNPFAILEKQARYQTTGRMYELPGVTGSPLEAQEESL